MKIIRPTEVTDAVLTSSSVPENDLPDWSSTITYALNAQVQRAHQRWASAIANNLNHDPAANDGNWTAIGPTNRWAMFDQAVGTITTTNGTLTIVLAPGSIDALAVLDTTADSVTVTMTVSGVQLYNETLSANVGGQAIDNWYSYFFEPIGRRDTIIFDDLPIYSAGVVTVSMVGSDPAGPVGCGTLIIGRQLELGSTEAGAQPGIIDYSVKSTNEFGATTVVERAFAKRMSGRFMCDTTAVDALLRAIAAVRAKPVLWIGEEGFDCLTMYGFFKDFSFDLSYAPDPFFGSAGTSYGSFTIEGLI